jgi:propionyl-CoA carboxylase alpha chain
LITNKFDNGEEVTLQYLDTLPLGFRVQHLGTKFDITINNPAQHALSKFMPIKEKASTTNMILSPMPGSVVSVDVKVGDVVAEGTAVATIEAMKMANVLRSVRAGTVKSVKVKAGDSVAGDELLIEFEDETKEAPAKTEKK